MSADTSSRSRPAQIARWLVAAVATFAVGAALVFAWQYTVARAVDAEVARRMAPWEFTEPLFLALPKDIDFLVRNLEIDLKDGSDVWVMGRRGQDDFRLTLSQVRKLEAQRYAAILGINGRMGESAVRYMQQPISIARGECTSEINAAAYEFYVCVEEIRMDSKAVLALARRHAHPWMGRTFISGGSGRSLSISGPRPDPIVRPRGE